MEITFTREELELMSIQIGSRSGHFDTMLIDAAKNKNIDRIKEIMKAKEVFDSIMEKITKLKTPVLRQDGFRKSSSGVERI